MTKKIKIIILLSIVGIVLFFIMANFIVINECASPCRHEAEHSEKPIMCPSVCEKVTLLDWILGNG